MTVNEYNTSVDKFSDNVYRFVLKSVKDSDKAKDIVQDTYEKLWLHHSEVDVQKVQSYLFSTAYHRFIDIIRHESKQEPYEGRSGREPFHNEQYTGLSEILNEAVSKLPEIQRAVVLLRDYEGYSYDEIAEITQLSESQVKVYIYRARVFLKNFIGTPEAVI